MQITCKKPGKSNILLHYESLGFSKKEDTNADGVPDLITYAPQTFDQLVSVEVLPNNIWGAAVKNGKISESREIQNQYGETVTITALKDASPEAIEHYLTAQPERFFLDRGTGPAGGLTLNLKGLTGLIVPNFDTTNNIKLFKITAHPNQNAVVHERDLMPILVGLLNFAKQVWGLQLVENEYTDFGFMAGGPTAEAGNVRANTRVELVMWKFGRNLEKITGDDDVDKVALAKAMAPAMEEASPSNLTDKQVYFKIKAYMDAIGNTGRIKPVDANW